ncbi:uncharacterized protein BN565_02504 [Clostridium sp. CAG:253]|nr:uncharacterized protein BN565_02504 [Clostridium sp. CAG:253]
MIHIGQLKVLVEKVAAKADRQDLKKGIISAGEMSVIKKYIEKKLKIKADDIRNIEILKKSVDARKKEQLSFVYQLDIECDNEKKIVSRYKKNDVSLKEKKTIVREINDNIPPENKGQTVIAGFGPAGIFAAYELAKSGYKPIVIERGLDVENRKKTVEKFWNTGELDTECNVSFGEGGAGTFSDGKLNTMVKDRFGYNRKVLETFVRFGAPKEILYLQKPHIGTDKLADVVKNMRLEIERLGGEVRFGVRLDSINTEKENETQKIVSVNVTDRESSQKQEIKCEKLILAIGHSARDTFISLHESDVEMQQKSFAIGVRVEHLQEMIGRNQYGDMYKILPTADYKLTHQTKDGRGVYSFCMCPGGYVVNASSQKGMLAVNGMSNYLRDSKNANSAMVVTVGPEDYESDDVLAGMRFQQKWEKKAYEAAGGKIPVQLFGDFKKDRVSSEFGEVIPETKGEYAFANVRKIIPESVASSIEEGITAFEKKIKGYSRDDTLLLGIESRTSSPVKILRDESMQSNIRGIYPCGEGAGYAGGITSAAMDGIKIAMQIKGGNYK